MTVKEGDIVRLTGSDLPGSTYQVYGLWPRGRAKLRSVKQVKGLGWVTVQPERTREVAIHWVQTITEGT